MQPAVVAYAPQVPSDSASITGSYSASTGSSYGGSSYSGIPVDFGDEENDQGNKKGWKAEMIKLIEDIRQNITELQEGINFFHFWTLEKLELDLIYHTLERFFIKI